MSEYRLSYADRPDDAPLEFLFYGESARLELRDRYDGYQCACCGKIPEFTAIRRAGIDERFRIMSSWDFVVTADDVPCVSQRFVESVRRHRIRGFDFIPLPGDDRYFVALPTIWVPVDIPTCGVRFGILCPQCQRFSETTYRPMLKSLSPRDDHADAVYSPAIFSESVRGRRIDFLAGEAVAQMLLDGAFSGLDIIKCRG